MSQPSRAKKLIQLKVAPELHSAFRRFTFNNDQDMSEVGARLIEQYLREHNALPAQQKQSA